MSTLDDRVHAYQRTGRGLTSLITSVSRLVYEYPRGRHGFTEEDGAELLLEFYPRIRRLIERYRPTGSSFEAYLRSSLRWQLRSIARGNAARALRHRVAVSPGTTEDICGPVATADGFAASVAERGPRAHAANERHLVAARPARRPAHRPSVLQLSPPSADGHRLTSGQAQRLVFLFLKSSDNVTDEQTARVARVAGCDCEWLAACRDRLMQRLQRYDERHRRFRTQRDRAWFALRYTDERLESAVGEERSALIARRSRLSLRYSRAVEGLRKTNHSPTHSEIAAVLGIQKGTVDSSIFTAKRELRDPEYQRTLATLLSHT